MVLAKKKANNINIWDDWIFLQLMEKLLVNCFFFPFFSPRSMISFSVSRCIFRFICLLPVGFDERKKNVPPVGTSDVVNFKENEIIHARCISIKRSSISDKEFCRSFFFFLFKKSN